MRTPSSNNVAKTFTDACESNAQALPTPRNKTTKILSIRVSEDEYAHLLHEAGNVTLSHYARFKLFDGKDLAPEKHRKRPKKRIKIPTAERALLAQILAAFGSSDLAGSMRDIADAARNGALEDSPAMLLTLQTACLTIERIRERLGEEDKLLSLDEAKAAMAHDMQFMLARLQSEQERKSVFQREHFLHQKEVLVTSQRAERKAFDEGLRLRQDMERRQRQTQFRKGLGGLWDRLRGEHKRLTEQHRLDMIASQQRDKAERDALIFKQQESRNALRTTSKTERALNQKTAHELQKDAERYHDDLDGRDNKHPFPNAPNVKTGFEKVAECAPSKADKMAEARRQFIEAQRSEPNRELQRNLDRER